MLTSKRQLRQKRIRAKISGTASRLRCSVFRSNRHFYAQLIDDTTGRTLLGLSDQNLPESIQVKKKRVEIAAALGAALAEAAKTKGFDQIVFDRRGYKYHGRVKAFVEGARQGGLKF